MKKICLFPILALLTVACDEGQTSHSKCDKSTDRCFYLDKSGKTEFIKEADYGKYGIVGNKSSSKEVRGMCVDKSVDTRNCGACGNDCSLLPNVKDPVCGKGQCTFKCKDGFEDADGNAANGCEKVKSEEQAENKLEVGSTCDEKFSDKHQGKLCRDGKLYACNAKTKRVSSTNCAKTCDADMTKCASVECDKNFKAKCATLEYCKIEEGSDKGKIEKLTKCDQCVEQGHMLKCLEKPHNAKEIGSTCDEHFVAECGSVNYHCGSDGKVVDMKCEGATPVCEAKGSQIACVKGDNCSTNGNSRCEGNKAVICDGKTQKSAKVCTKDCAMHEGMPICVNAPGTDTACNDRYVASCDNKYYCNIESGNTGTFSRLSCKKVCKVDENKKYMLTCVDADNLNALEVGAPCDADFNNVNKNLCVGNELFECDIRGDRKVKKTQCLKTCENNKCQGNSTSPGGKTIKIDFLSLCKITGSPNISCDTAKLKKIGLGTAKMTHMYNDGGKLRSSAGKPNNKGMSNSQGVINFEMPNGIKALSFDYEVFPRDPVGKSTIEIFVGGNKYKNKVVVAKQSDSFAADFGDQFKEKVNVVIKFSARFYVKNLTVTTH